jgi:hypothetical protein
MPQAYSIRKWPTLWLIPTILTQNTRRFSNVALYSFILMIESHVVLPASIVALASQPSVERAWQFAWIDTAIRVPTWQVVNGREVFPESASRDSLISWRP